MLKKMYLTNFMSFKERTEFDFTASKYSILGGKNVSDNNVLKGALLIGPNASGKSNVLKGLSFIIKMIIIDVFFLKILLQYWSMSFYLIIKKLNM